ncbi:uncharacterized protein LOC131226497 [Magnolia sinica]|uniref:uncharacterized protein LOC131226497 n=1 Tax=Magnolia sinica TaxID=86752 RepID=UPI00265A3F96|nr:uncharacterized protein LOC131226497 [Magnolia sinica]
MEQQGDYSNPTSPGFSVSQNSESQVQIQSNSMWSGRVSPDRSPVEGPQKSNFGPAAMSSEELKIRAELECEVERDLEEEIKDGICHLALRLHRLYQHQKEIGARHSSTKGAEFQNEARDVTFTEVNITIRIEGGSKFEVHESKKEICNKGYTQNKRLEDKKGKMGPSTKKFDWERTLRSGTSSVAIVKKVPDKDRATKTGHDVHRHATKDGRNLINGSDQGKRKIRMKHNKLLQLEWRN